jgi:hypothetical protein
MIWLLMLYLHLPSVHFHLTEVFPLGIPAGFLQIRLGDPPVDFLARGFERNGVRSKGFYCFQVHAIGPMIGTGDLRYRCYYETKG